LDALDQRVTPSKKAAMLKVLSTPKRKLAPQGGRAELLAPGNSISDPTYSIKVRRPHGHRQRCRSCAAPGRGQSGGAAARARACWQGSACRARCRRGLEGGAMVVPGTRPQRGARNPTSGPPAANRRRPSSPQDPVYFQDSADTK
jgi:hypothetical protein